MGSRRKDAGGGKNKQEVLNIQEILVPKFYRKFLIGERISLVTAVAANIPLIKRRNLWALRGLRVAGNCCLSFIPKFQ